MLLAALRAAVAVARRVETPKEVSRHAALIVEMTRVRHWIFVHEKSAKRNLRNTSERNPNSLPPMRPGTRFARQVAFSPDYVVGPSLSPVPLPRY